MNIAFTKNGAFITPKPFLRVISITMALLPLQVRLASLEQTLKHESLALKHANVFVLPPVRRQSLLQEREELP